MLPDTNTQAKQEWEVTELTKIQFDRDKKLSVAQQTQSSALKHFMMHMPT